MTTSTPWPQAESSMAQPCGTCYRCGGQMYALLVHHCTTSLRMPPLSKLHMPVWSSR